MAFASAQVRSSSSSLPLFVRAHAFALTAGAALVLHALPGLAQTPADIQQIEKLQREEQLRQQRQLEQDRARARPPASLEVEPPKRPAARKEGPCRDVKEIKLSGVKLLTFQTQEALIAPYVGKCLGVNDIERLMGDVTAHYVHAGYIAARVYLGKQDLSSGKLELTVVEGKLGKLRIEDGEKKSISRFNVFPGMLGKPLNLRNVEQGLDQINRLASNNATMSIEPGAEPGESELVIKNEPAKPWRVNVSSDTFGSASTGRTQGGASVSVDNPLGFNDFFSMSDRRTLDTDGSRRRSRSNSFSYTIPFGATLVSAGYSQSTYLTTFTTPGGVDIVSDGESSISYVRGDRVVWRDRTNLLTLSGTVTRKRSDNYFAGQFLQVSSRILTVADVDLSLRTRLAGGVLFLGAGASHGLNTMGALDDASNLPDIAPRAQFDKQRVSANWSTQVPLANNHTLDVSTQISAQYARDVLYGTEHLSIGGVYSVRGFNDNSLANDIGWMVRNELGVTTPFLLRGKPGTWRVYGAVDAGKVRGAVGGGIEGGLAGAALGMQVRVANATLDTFVMAPLHTHPTFTPERPSLHAALSISF